MNENPLPKSCLIVAAVFVGLAIGDVIAIPSEQTSIVIEPVSGELAALGEDDAIRVTFPTPMVEVEKLRRGGQACPIIFEPVVETRWLWLSPTEGKLTFPTEFVHENVAHQVRPAAVIRKVKHTARLRPGLRNLANQPVDEKKWGVEFANDRFALRSLKFLNAYDSGSEADDEPTEKSKDDSEKESEDPGNSEEDSASEDSADDPDIQSRAPTAPLPAKPQIRLEFSRDVVPKDLLELVYFQDIGSEARYPVEVNLEERQSLAPQGWVIVEPVAPLPPGRSFLLVIDRLKEPSRGETLPHLRTVPAGTTYPPEIEWVGGLNQPLKGTFITVTANQSINGSEENLKLVTIDPPVPGVTITHIGNGIQLFGKFDIAKTYQLKVAAGLLTDDGFRLAEDSVWKVSFNPKRPAIVLPETFIFQRASNPQIRCDFVQVNTEELDWKIARIPRELVGQVRERLREFENFVREKDGSIIRNPQTGENLFQTTELLIPALRLPVVAEGNFPSSGQDAETARTVLWQPAEVSPDLFLLEISGVDLNGRQIGNRSIVSRTDWMITSITASAKNILRVTNMNDGKPVAGVSLETVNLKGEISSPWTTSQNGEVEVGEVSFGAWILAGLPGHQSAHLLDLPSLSKNDGYSGRNDAKLMSVLVSDRNIYRPGETVKFKGFVRLVGSDGIALPEDRNVQWSISGEDDAAAEGEASISDNGTFEGEWTIPITCYGNYYLEVGGMDHQEKAKITVAEFRPPPFSVVTDADVSQGTTAKLQVSSTLFSGQPNAGAKVRWRAEWMVDDWRRDLQDYDHELTDAEEELLDFELKDDHSPDSPTGGFSSDVVGGLAKAGWSTARADREVSTTASVSGEATLDAEGRAAIACASPFPPNAIHGRAMVYWVIDVTETAAGQTVRGGTAAKIQFVPQVLGVNLDSAEGKNLALKVCSLDPRDRFTSGLPVKAEVFRIEVKTVKERLADDLNRYRNFPQFEKVWEGTMTTPASRTVPVPEGGDYIVRVSAPGQPGTAQVSARAEVYSDEETDVEVTDDTSLQVTSDRSNYNAGETAAFTVHCPFSGVATVSVQTDRVLHQEVVELKGNTQRIEVLITSDYAPNVWVCVHMVKPAMGGGIPTERFGACPITVTQPDQKLQVEPILTASSLEPGQAAGGVVRVSSQGQPVPDAEVLVFVVDESVLALGRWKMPTFDSFYPRRNWSVSTTSALSDLWDPQKPNTLTHSQKGFILGDAGPILADVNFRRAFKPLAFWDAHLRTDAKGEAPFHFVAPEGLTSYRVMAIALHNLDQFGSGATVLKLGKKLQVEPVLPAFLRRGDEVMIQASIRESHADTDEVNLAIEVDAGLTLEEPAVKRVSLRRDEPALVRFGPERPVTHRVHESALQRDQPSSPI